MVNRRNARGRGIVLLRPSANRLRANKNRPKAVSRTQLRPLKGLRRLHQAAATPMPLNSPVAMRFCHSAGPVMWALVPPESTATVTGMSTTSNS